MTTNEIMRSRRVALRMTKFELAEKVGVNVNVISLFEDGVNVPKNTYEKIKEVLRNEFNSLKPEEHYRARILELAIEIRDEKDAKFNFDYIGHMMIELGKLMAEVNNSVPKSKKDWE